jgi:hypothetical protein
MSDLKKTGEKRVFTSGAHRDAARGKGSMISLPAAAMIRLAKHYEIGAETYGALNYQKGMPTSELFNSAMRHMFRYADGMDDEDHLSAAAWNVLAMIFMEERKPEMQDIEARKGKKTSFYFDDEK